jgi:hypothetical protein
MDRTVNARVFTGDVAWDFSVNASDVPQAGGNVTVSIQTNAGTPSAGGDSARVAKPLISRRGDLTNVWSAAGLQEI